MSWLLERAGLALTIGAIALVIIVVYLVVYLANKERRDELALRTYNNLRAGSWITIGTLIIGVIASFAVAVALMAGIDYVLAAAMHNPRVYARTFWIRQLLSAVPSFWFSFYFIFWLGVFEVPPGEKAFLKILGIPFGRLGAGYGWVFPFLMEVVFITTRARQISSEGTEEFVTANGIEMEINSGATVVIQDPLLVQGIVSSEIDRYLDDQRRAAIRRYISERRVDILATPDEETDLNQVEKFFSQFKEVKGEIAKNGPEIIRGYMNEAITAYGLHCTQVQLEEVLFNETLESKAQRYFDEMLESLGLVQDAFNKGEVAKKLNEKILEGVGLKLENLSTEDKLDFARRGLAAALSAEGQGNYSYVDFGQSRPPKGVLITTPTGPSPTTPKQSNSGDNDNGARRNDDH